MKKTLFILIALVVFTITGCEKKEDDTVVNQPPPAANQIVFWSDFTGPPISVNIGSSNAGTITAVSSSAPSCGSSGNVTKTVSPGTYSFDAQETAEPFRTWSGSFTMESNTSCFTFLLHL